MSSEGNDEVSDQAIDSLIGKLEQPDFLDSLLGTLDDPNAKVSDLVSGNTTKKGQLKPKEAEKERHFPCRFEYRALKSCIESSKEMGEDCGAQYRSHDTCTADFLASLKGTRAEVECAKSIKLFTHFPFKPNKDDAWILNTLFEELYDCAHTKMGPAKK